MQVVVHSSFYLRWAIRNEAACGGVGGTIKMAAHTAYPTRSFALHKKIVVTAIVRPGEGLLSARRCHNEAPGKVGTEP